MNYLICLVTLLAITNMASGLTVASVDITAPSLLKAEVLATDTDGVLLTFDEDIAANGNVNKDDFEVKVNNEIVPIESAVLDSESNRFVTLKLEDFLFYQNQLVILTILLVILFHLTYYIILNY